MIKKFIIFFLFISYNKNYLKFYKLLAGKWRGSAFFNYSIKPKEKLCIKKIAIAQQCFEYKVEHSSPKPFPLSLKKTLLDNSIKKSLKRINTIINKIPNKF